MSAKQSQANWNTEFPGVYHWPDFLNLQECAELAQLAKHERSLQARLINQKGIYDNEQIRKTKQLLLPPPKKAWLTYRLMQIKDALALPFGLRLKGIQPPQLLAYEPGDFFQKHHDAFDKPTKLATFRHLTVIVFINPATDYLGGQLYFYELAESWPEPGRAFLAQAGDLIAFSPEIYHSVSPVEQGERYSLVSWYY